MPCLTLHTAHPDSLYRNEAPPYRQVMGLTVENVSLWRPDYDVHGSTQPELLEVTDVFAGRLLRFFNVYLTVPRGQTPEYDCHLFAGVLAGSVRLEDGHDDLMNQASQIAQNIVAYGLETSGPLPLGAQGVIGLREPDYANPYHSVIGLGLESDECLQVNHTYGELGIQRYERNAIAYPPFLKLYVGQ